MDGYADPTGETIGKLKGFYAQSPATADRLARPGDPPVFLRTMEKKYDPREDNRLTLMNRSGEAAAPVRYAQAQEIAGDAAPESKARERPTLNLGKDRRRSIIDNTPARFDIADNPKEDGAAPHWRDHNAGREAVKTYDGLIVREAERQGVDPDLVRAVLYYEMADGGKAGFDKLADQLGISRSQQPMGIRSDVWGPLGLAKENATNPEDNIRASVTLLGRIIDRLDDPSPEQIGTLWNSLSQETVSQRGARIGRVYQEREWEKPAEAGEVGNGYP